MRDQIIQPFVRLFATSPEIERQPFLARPRTMAAVWGGLLACKLATMVLGSPAEGAALFTVTLAAGVFATYARFGSQSARTAAEPVVSASPA